MNDLFIKIDKLKAEMTKYRPLNKKELEVLRENFIIESSYNSNAIEGNSLTLSETTLLLKDGVTVAKKPIKDYLDMIGYKDAFYYIIELARMTKNTISEQEIKQIHSLVLANNMNRGVYRLFDVYISGSTHEPPQPYMISPLMEALISNYRQWIKERHILEAIGLFHLEFESIHPFIDGNGRTGRLILNLELIRNGYLPINIKFTDRGNYYQAFESFRKNEAKDDSGMIKLISEYQLMELEKRLEILRSIKKYSSDYTNM